METQKSFGRYVDDEQRCGLARALMDKGYDVSTSEHGGWGGGTEWNVRRWRTRYHVLLGWVLPITAVIAMTVAPRDGYGWMAFDLACLATTMIGFILFALPEFSATFMWWDGESEWDASGGGEEFEKLIPVIEEASGRKVRRCRS